MDDKKQPIVIKKVVKGHAHHGGAWKVAYADFVTAMMAFFLLMWLLGSSTKPQREGISDFFKHPSAIQGPGGASTSMIKLGGTKDMPTGPTQMHSLGGARAPTAEEMRKAAEAREHQRMQTLEVELRKAIDRSQALRPFKDQLLIDITPEGLRIQIVDKENRPMFDLGSDILKSYARRILEKIGDFLNHVPNKISITGHTDAHRFLNADMSNWELSTERANAARRALIAGGMNSDKVARIVGLGDTVLFDKQNPLAAVNRRISIIVLNKQTEAAMAKGDAYVSGATPTAGGAAPATAEPAAPEAGTPAGAAAPSPATHTQ
ncbi:flagellar motor protein MotB [Acidihalobacter prosperus]|uniref:Flagellar motor protein MotB n=1 Tax=Acidihalobacter prosperus TaxID=160660 RepID=A0A1A6C1Y5_9GAMM|nr:flagellar motor protein MotB [Acidihalobacter prosperus]OBS08577.1 flagellar motor protein MotB [Acidihalobacter prosperus]